MNWCIIKYSLVKWQLFFKDKLLEIQERRREIGRHLAEIRQKSLALQDQLHKVKRQDDMDKFLELMKEETEVKIIHLKYCFCQVSNAVIPFVITGE